MQGTLLSQLLKLKKRKWQRYGHIVILNGSSVWRGSEWDNNGKPGNQVATKSEHSNEIFGKNPDIITIYEKFIY